jgi:hypothetical protein
MMPRRNNHSISGKVSVCVCVWSRRVCWCRSVNVTLRQGERRSQIPYEFAKNKLCGSACDEIAAPSDQSCIQRAGHGWARPGLMGRPLCGTAILFFANSYGIRIRGETRSPQPCGAGRWRHNTKTWNAQSLLQGYQNRQARQSGPARSSRVAPSRGDDARKGVAAGVTDYSFDCSFCSHATILRFMVEAHLLSAWSRRWSQCHKCERPSGS